MTEIQDLADRLRSAIQQGARPAEELLANAATALERIERECVGLERDLANYSEWENELAELVPESYDADEAQTAIIERFMRDLVATHADHPGVTAHRVISFDADTGEQLEPTNAATGEVWARIASQALPGTDPEQVQAWYTAWLESDGLAFAVGNAVVGVNDPQEQRGTVAARVVSGDGELHTVLVAWPGMVSAQAYSPRELREVSRG